LNDSLLPSYSFRLVIVIVLITKGLGLSAQPFDIDTTFQPFFDIRSGLGKGRVTDIYEDRLGKLYISGSFNFISSPSYSNEGLTSVNRDGSQNQTFLGFTGGMDHFVYASDTTIMLGGSAIFNLPIDSTGAIQRWNWVQNIRSTVSCSKGQGKSFYLSDGSSIHANGDNTSGQPCPIINSPDTFQGQHLIKVTPQGLWDSTWLVNSIKEPNDIIRYDTNRLLLVGNPLNFSSYNGKPIRGLCRIFLDGTLDTSFSSPLLDTFSVVNVAEISYDGSFYLVGNFFLDNRSTPNTLVKLNPNGTLDSSFANFMGPTDTTNGPDFASVTSLVQTDDKGFLVGGVFDHYQGSPKKNIAKIDSTGILETQYFTSRGPDSSLSLGNLFSFIYIIKKSKFGGYYVGGDFLKWDGQPSQPIVRLNQNLTNSIKEKSSKSDFVIYPNPSEGNIFIKSTKRINHIEIYGLDGKLINNFSSFERISLPENRSIYLLKATLIDGTIVIRKVLRQ